VTDIANSYVNDPLGLVCLAFQLLAGLLCAEVGFANEVTKVLDGQGLRKLQNAVLEKIFRRKEEEATGDWRKFHNELHDLYSLPNRWVESVARWGEKYIYTEMCWKTRRNENIWKTFV